MKVGRKLLFPPTRISIFCIFVHTSMICLAMIPMVFTMAVAFFVIHGNDPFATKELAFVYLVVFILMYIIGPGKFAVDRWIRKALFQKARK